MASMPEIGSKISLISKADIRYEGKLFTVDPNECTIALSHVRSFGTEDRQTQYPVPAQNQIYEYILFRGSDIKDISIVNAQQLPNDPAIVSGHVQPSLPSYGSYNPPLVQYNSYGAAPGMGRTIGKSAMSSELPPQDPPPIQVPIPGPGPPGPIMPIVKEPNTELLAGSRSSTPSLSRKSPTNDQGIQTTPPHKDKKVIQPPVPREGRQSRNNERNYQDQGYQQRRDYRNQRENDNYRGQRDNEYRGRDQEYRGRDQEYRGRDQEYRGRDQEYRGQRDGDYRGPRDQDRRDMYMNQQRGQMQGMNRGGWVNRGGRGGPGPNMRGNPRGRGGPGGNFNRAPGAGPNPNQQNNAAAAKKNTLKFDEEYDFDKANSEFEELTKKTAKLKIGEPGGESTVEGEEKPKVNGEDKKDDSGNETGLGEAEHDEDTDQENTIFYDKAKSFFDNISCEAIERSKGRSQRTDWRTERKLNSETFGVASARRGGYRGRGGYYRGGMYRGGYRGYNPRGQQNRQHINQPRHATQPHSQPQPATAAAK